MGHTTLCSKMATRSLDVYHGTWEERDTPGPKPGMKALRRERWARREEVRTEFAEGLDAQVVMLYARERAAFALRSSQRSAADGVGEDLPQQVEEGDF